MYSYSGGYNHRYAFLYMQGSSNTTNVLKASRIQHLVSYGHVKIIDYSLLRSKSYSSVHLRPGTVCLPRALLTAAYRLCLQSISTCIVTSHHRQYVQATAVWPHGCSFKLNIYSKSRPRLLQAWFRRSDDEKVLPKWHLLQINHDWKAAYTIHPMKV